MDWQKNRLWIGGVALALIGGAAAYAVSRNTGDTPEDEIEAPLNFPDLDEDDITALEITRPDEEPVRLERRDDVWWVVAPLEARADQGAVSTALDKLDELRVDGIAANNASHHEELEVDTAHGVHVVAFGEGGELANLWIGGTRSANTMVRVDGQDQVVSVRGSIKFAFNKALREWRDRAVLDLTSDDVIEIAWRGPNGTFRFVRPRTEAAEGEPEGEEGEPAGPTYGEWQIAEVSYVPAADPDAGVPATPPAPLTTIEGFNASRVRSMVTTLARMRGSDFGPADLTADAAGFTDASPRVTLTVRDGDATRTETVVLGGPSGGESGDGEHYAMHEGDATIFVVSRHLSDRLSPTAASFQQTAAATPEPSEGPPGGMPGMPPEGLTPEMMRALEAAMGGAGGGHP